MDGRFRRHYDERPPLAGPAACHPPNPNLSPSRGGNAAAPVGAAVDTEARPRHPLLVPAGCVVGLAVLAFLPLLRNGFIDWDDPTQIVQNPRLNPPTAAGLAEYWSSPRLGEEFYVPINYTVSWLLASVGAAARSGDGSIPAWPYHAASWLVHAANAALVLVILHRLTGRRWASAAGAAVFAVHPVQVEPLAWAASNYSPLSGLFALVSVWQYLVFSDRRHRGDLAEASSDAPSVSRPGGWGHYFVAFVSFVAAMLTKPTVVTVPLIIAVIEVGFRGRRLRDVVLPVGVMLALAVPVVLLVRSASTRLRSTSRRRRGGHCSVDTLAFYLYKLVAPVWLCPDYGRSPQWVLSRQELYYTWIAPVVLLAVAWHAGRSSSVRGTRGCSSRG